MKPVFGYCFFNVSSNGLFNEVIIFEYIDVEREYSRIISDEGSRREEIRKLRVNMQSFIDEEVVKVNGERVHPRVVAVDIGVSNGGERAYAYFLIEFQGRLRINDFNVYEDTYESERADYDYVVTWKLPRGSRVVEAEFGFKVRVGPDNVLTFNVRRGEVTPGYERLVFYLRGT